MEPKQLGNSPNTDTTIPTISKPIRGTIKVEVSTSETAVNISSDFSIFVIVRNPFDVPITVYSVQTHIPSQLVDSIWLQKLQCAQREGRLRRVERTKGMGKIGAIISNWWEEVLEKLRIPAGSSVAEAVGPEIDRLPVVPPESRTTLNVEAGAQVSADNLVAGAFNEVWNLEFPNNPTNDELDRIFMKVEDFRAGRIPVILQPGNAVVKQFILKARHWLFFTPISYNFHVQVRYAVDGKENVDTEPFNLEIRAALRATIIGGVAGGVIGALARSFGTRGEPMSIGVLLLSAIFGAVTVVALARKSGAQSIVSIEDFWGGLLVGFLTGYLGENFFSEVVGAGETVPPEPATPPG
jgi:hypothetical protein